MKTKPPPLKMNGNLNCNCCGKNDLSSSTTTTELDVLMLFRVLATKKGKVIDQRDANPSNSKKTSRNLWVLIPVL